MMEALTELLHAVGGELQHLRAAGAVEGRWEGAQFKAEADLLAHRLLVAGLSRLDPETPVLSEEDARARAGARPARYWLIDPIDGTASFAGGFDGWVTQAALMVGGAPVLAAVHAPARGTCYNAEKGAGARCDGRPMRLPETGEEPRVLIDNYPEPRGAAAALMRDLGIDGYVESGSIGLKICRVAAGEADLFFKDVAIRDWDVAAPGLILEEAGGLLRRLDGSRWTYDGPWEKDGLIAAGSPEVLAAADAQRGSKA
jgi:fructose-1,6-bisphosphatase/inositol monophosphatase family enzyme